MSATLPPLTNNMLLSRLNPRELRRVEAASSFVELGQGAVVCEEGKPVAAAYFPISNVFSTLLTDANGWMVETSVIGIEGMVGANLTRDILLPSPNNVEQQITGDSVTIPAQRFVKLLAEVPKLRPIIDRFTQALIFQASLATLCLRSHTADRRLARWLLETVDRCGRQEIHLKQDYLAAMMGVSRPCVNRYIQRLRDEAMIDHRRGRIIIRDFGKLESKACDCYARNRRRYQDFMKLTPPKAYASYQSGGGRWIIYRLRVSSASPVTFGA